jgi:hypothetical protein
MNFEKSLKQYKKFFEARQKFNSLDELKKLTEEIHEIVMVEIDDNIDWDNIGQQWASGIISSNITTSSTMEAIEWIKTFRFIHPELDEQIKNLEYFKNFSEEIGARFMAEGRTTDSHNCILKNEGGRWEWKTKEDKTPRAIRTITKAQHIPTKTNLIPIINMVESSYVALNANMVNNLKILVTNDVGDGGYDPKRIEDSLDNTPTDGAHGFMLVGDIGFDYTIKGPFQQEIRLILNENYIQGTLRLINYMGYPGSRKNYKEDYTNVPEIKLLIEGGPAIIDLNGNSIVPSQTEEDYSKVTV